MRICPTDKFIEIFALRFHYFKDPFYKFFALNLLFQDTRYSLALKYSSFLFKFFSFAFYNINFWFKISKICPKNSHFSQIAHSRGNPQLHNPMSHKYRYILLYSILLSSQTLLLNPGHMNLNRTTATEANQTAAVMRIKPKISAAHPIMRCALSTELSRSRGNLAQNGA